MSGVAGNSIVSVVSVPLNCTVSMLKFSSTVALEDCPLFSSQLGHPRDVLLWQYSALSHAFDTV